MRTIRRMRAFIILALFGLLFLTGCRAKSQTVINDRGIDIGEIRVEDENTALVIDRYGQNRGRIQGTVVRNEKGGRVGEVSATEGTARIKDKEDKEIGRLENGDCLKADGTKLGSIRGGTDLEASGGACLILLLVKEQQ